jgi:hypothetical protein
MHPQIPLGPKCTRRSRRALDPGKRKGGPQAALPTRQVSERSAQKWMIGMIRIATMFATLIIGLIAGPAVSL